MVYIIQQKNKEIFPHILRSEPFVGGKISLFYVRGIGVVHPTYMLLANFFTNTSIPIWVFLIPSTFVFVGVLLRMSQTVIRHYQKRQRIWDLLLGTRGEGPLFEEKGMIEQVRELLVTMANVVESAKMANKIADRALKVAISAHRRLDRAGIEISPGREVEDDEDG